MLIEGGWRYLEEMQNRWMVTRDEGVYEKMRRNNDEGSDLLPAE